MWYLAIDRRKPLEVCDQRAEIAVTQMDEDFAGHDDERRAVASDAITNCAHPIIIAELRRNPAPAARQVRTGNDAHRAGVHVNSTTEVRAVAQRARSERPCDVAAALDGCTVRGNDEGTVPGWFVPLVDDASAAYKRGSNGSEESQDNDGQGERNPP